MAELIRNTPIQNELLRNNRFELRFPTDIGLESIYLKTCDKPKFNQNKVDLPYMNIKYTVPGQIEWGEMSMSMICTIGPSSPQQLMEWIRLGAESITGRQGYAAGYMKTLELHSLDPTGVSVERWDLINCWVVSADFGSLDMADDGVQEISFVIQPQMCIQRY